jgi:uncharacterized protein YecE (DUF72 family)
VLNFAFFRWHGRRENPWFDYKYTNEELNRWVPSVQSASEEVKRVYGYFNNHFHGYAPENCLYLVERLGILSDSRKQPRKNLA